MKKKTDPTLGLISSHLTKHVSDANKLSDRAIQDVPEGTGWANCPFNWKLLVFWPDHWDLTRFDPSRSDRCGCGRSRYLSRRLMAEFVWCGGIFTAPRFLLGALHDTAQPVRRIKYLYAEWSSAHPCGIDNSAFNDGHRWSHFCLPVPGF